MPRTTGEASGGGGNGGGGENKGFYSKPARGWLHPDQLILNEGVTFDVRYIGCLEVNTSMKILDFQTRSQVAKECINRVCEAGGLKSTKKRRIDKRILQAISDQPKMENAGTNVTLTISSKCLSLVNIDTGDLIAKHDMPRISFASGGDTDTLDFVAYVAKNLEEWRACYVLECGGGHAQDLISTIGQAFELRYNEFFIQTNEINYYNDLPGKIPPGSSNLSTKLSQLNIRKPRERISSNLIDLNSPPAEHNYVNEKYTDSNSNNTTVSTALSTTGHGGCVSITSASGNPNSNSTVRDVFDMQPISLSAEVQRTQLMTEIWYHGGISRPISESLLKNDGDFLVRESQGTPGQYVLTGMQNVTPKHLLLMDPEGCVRTKDRLFESVSHLINYHWTNSLPIVSAESALVLRTPILKNGGGEISNNKNSNQHAMK